MSVIESAERCALVALVDEYRVKRSDIVSTILEKDDPAASLQLLEEQLQQTEGLLRRTSVAEVLDRTAARIDAWAARDIAVHTCFDDSYPQQLSDIHEMPLVVFTRGELADDERSVAVVGTRGASEKALRRTGGITRSLAAEDITIVSGLAAGVDAQAHRTALGIDARTVAVVANGVDQYYPTANRDLQDRIATRGLVLSEYPPGIRPQKWQFLERNAIMSGYAAATVVVEAGERSGTRTQVNRAIRHGRMVILLEDVLAVSWAREAVGHSRVRIAKDLPELLDHVAEALDRRMPAFTTLF